MRWSADRPLSLRLWEDEKETRGPLVEVKVVGKKGDRIAVWKHVPGKDPRIVWIQAKNVKSPDHEPFLIDPPEGTEDEAPAIGDIGDPKDFGGTVGHVKPMPGKETVPETGWLPSLKLKLLAAKLKSLKVVPQDTFSTALEKGDVPDEMPTPVGLAGLKSLDAVEPEPVPEDLFKSVQDGDWDAIKDDQLKALSPGELVSMTSLTTDLLSSFEQEDDMPQAAAVSALAAKVLGLKGDKEAAKKYADLADEYAVKAGKTPPSPLPAEPEVPEPAKKQAPPASAAVVKAAIAKDLFASLLVWAGDQGFDDDATASLLDAVNKADKEKRWQDAADLSLVLQKAAEKQGQTGMAASWKKMVAGYTANLNEPEKASLAGIESAAAEKDFDQLAAWAEAGLIGKSHLGPLVGAYQDAPAGSSEELKFAQIVQQTYASAGADEHAKEWDAIVFGLKAGQEPETDDIKQAITTGDTDQLLKWAEAGQLGDDDHQQIGKAYSDAKHGSDEQLGFALVALAHTTKQGAKAAAANWQGTVDFLKASKAEKEKATEPEPAPAKPSSKKEVEQAVADLNFAKLNAWAEAGNLKSATLFDLVNAAISSHKATGDFDKALSLAKVALKQVEKEGLPPVAVASWKSEIAELEKKAGVEPEKEPEPEVGEPEGVDDVKQAINNAFDNDDYSTLHGWAEAGHLDGADFASVISKEAAYREKTGDYGLAIKLGAVMQARAAQLSKGGSEKHYWDTFISDVKKAQKKAEPSDQPDLDDVKKAIQDLDIDTLDAWAADGKLKDNELFYLIGAAQSDHAADKDFDKALSLAKVLLKQVEKEGLEGATAAWKKKVADLTQQAGDKEKPAQPEKPDVKKAIEDLDIDKLTAWAKNDQLKDDHLFVLVADAVDSYAEKKDYAKALSLAQVALQQVEAEGLAAGIKNWKAQVADLTQKAGAASKEPEESKKKAKIALLLKTGDYKSLVQKAKEGKLDPDEHLQVTGAFDSAVSKADFVQASMLAKVLSTYAQAVDDSQSVQDTWSKEAGTYALKVGSAKPKYGEASDEDVVAIKKMISDALGTMNFDAMKASAAVPGALNSQGIAKLARMYDDADEESNARDAMMAAALLAAYEKSKGNEKAADYWSSLEKMWWGNVDPVKADIKSAVDAGVWDKLDAWATTGKLPKDEIFNLSQAASEAMDAKEWEKAEKISHALALWHAEHGNPAAVPAWKAKEKAASGLAGKEPDEPAAEPKKAEPPALDVVKKALSADDTKLALRWAKNGQLTDTTIQTVKNAYSDEPVGTPKEYLLALTIAAHYKAQGNTKEEGEWNDVVKDKAKGLGIEPGTLPGAEKPKKVEPGSVDGKAVTSFITAGDYDGLLQAAASGLSDEGLSSLFSAWHASKGGSKQEYDIARTMAAHYKAIGDGGEEWAWQEKADELASELGTAPPEDVPEIEKGKIKPGSVDGGQVAKILADENFDKLVALAGAGGLSPTGLQALIKAWQNSKNGSQQEYEIARTMAAHYKAVGDGQAETWQEKADGLAADLGIAPPDDAPETDDDDSEDGPDANAPDYDTVWKEVAASNFSTLMGWAQDGQLGDETIAAVASAYGEASGKKEYELARILAAHHQEQGDDSADNWADEVKKLGQALGMDPDDEPETKPHEKPGEEPVNLQTFKDTIAAGDYQKFQTWAAQGQLGALGHAGLQAIGVAAAEAAKKGLWLKAGGYAWALKKHHDDADHADMAQYWADQEQAYDAAGEKDSKDVPGAVAQALKDLNFDKLLYHVKDEGWGGEESEAVIQAFNAARMQAGDDPEKAALALALADVMHQRSLFKEQASSANVWAKKIEQWSAVVKKPGPIDDEKFATSLKGGDYDALLKRATVLTDKQLTDIEDLYYKLNQSDSPPANVLFKLASIMTAAEEKIGDDKTYWQPAVDKWAAVLTQQPVEKPPPLTKDEVTSAVAKQAFADLKDKAKAGLLPQEFVPVVSAQAFNAMDSGNFAQAADAAAVMVQQFAQMSGVQTAGESLKQWLAQEQKAMQAGVDKGIAEKDGRLLYNMMVKHAAPSDELIDLLTDSITDAEGVDNYDLALSRAQVMLATLQKHWAGDKGIAIDYWTKRVADLTNAAAIAKKNAGETLDPESEAHAEEAEAEADEPAPEAADVMKALDDLDYEQLDGWAMAGKLDDKAHYGKVQAGVTTQAEEGNWLAASNLANALHARAVKLGEKEEASGWLSLISAYKLVQKFTKTPSPPKNDDVDTALYALDEDGHEFIRAWALRGQLNGHQETMVQNTAHALAAENSWENAQELAETLRAMNVQNGDFKDAALWNKLSEKWGAELAKTAEPSPEPTAPESDPTVATTETIQSALDKLDLVQLTKWAKAGDLGQMGLAAPLKKKWKEAKDSGDYIMANVIASVLLARAKEMSGGNEEDADVTFWAKQESDAYQQSQGYSAAKQSAADVKNVIDDGDLDTLSAWATQGLLDNAAVSVLAAEAADAKKSGLLKLRIGLAAALVAHYEKTGFKDLAEEWKDHLEKAKAAQKAALAAEAEPATPTEAEKAAKDEETQIVVLTNTGEYDALTKMAEAGKLSAASASFLEQQYAASMSDGDFMTAAQVAAVLRLRAKQAGLEDEAKKWGDEMSAAQKARHENKPKYDETVSKDELAAFVTKFNNTIEQIGFDETVAKAKQGQLPVEMAPLLSELFADAMTEENLERAWQIASILKAQAKSSTGDEKHAAYWSGYAKYLKGQLPVTAGMVSASMESNRWGDLNAWALAGKLDETQRKSLVDAFTTAKTDDPATAAKLAEVLELHAIHSGEAILKDAWASQGEKLKAGLAQQKGPKLTADVKTAVETADWDNLKKWAADGKLAGEMVELLVIPAFNAAYDAGDHSTAASVAEAVAAHWAQSGDVTAANYWQESVADHKEKAGVAKPKPAFSNADVYDALSSEDFAKLHDEMAEHLTGPQKQSVFGVYQTAFDTGKWATVKAVADVLAKAAVEPATKDHWKSLANNALEKLGASPSPTPAPPPAPAVGSNIGSDEFQWKITKLPTDYVPPTVLQAADTRVKLGLGLKEFVHPITGDIFLLKDLKPTLHYVDPKTGYVFNKKTGKLVKTAKTAVPTGKKWLAPDPTDLEQKVGTVVPTPAVTPSSLFKEGFVPEQKITPSAIKAGDLPPVTPAAEPPPVKPTKSSTTFGKLKMKKPAGIPDVSDLKLLGSGNHMGGAGDKQIYEDDKGGKWMFKLAYEKSGTGAKPYAAVVQQLCSDLALRFRPDNVVVGVATIKGKIGTLQPLMDLDPNQPDLRNTKPKDLSDSDRQVIANEHLLDWLTSQHDSHGAQFIRSKDGKLFGVDKEQGFRFFGSDKLDVNYHPNPEEPYYNTFWKSWVAGDFEFDPLDMRERLEEMEAIGRPEYAASLRPYAETLYPDNPVAQAKFMKLAGRRRVDLRKNFEAFLTDLHRKKHKTDAGTFTFAKGWMDKAAGPKKVKKKLTFKTEDTGKANSPFKSDGSSSQPGWDIQVGGYEGLKVKPFYDPATNTVDPTKLTLKVPVGDIGGIDKIQQLLEKLGVQTIRPPKNAKGIEVGGFVKGSQYTMYFVKKADFEKATMEIEETIEPAGEKLGSTPAKAHYFPDDYEATPAAHNQAGLKQVEAAKLGHAGKRFSADGPMVEGGSFKVQRYEDKKGGKYHLVSFKLRKSAWKKLKSPQSSSFSWPLAGYNEQKDIYKEVGGHVDSVDALRWTSGDTEVYVANEAYKYGYMGYCFIKVPEAAGDVAKAAYDALEQVKPGLAKDIFRDPTPEEDEIRKLSSIYAQVAPQQSDNLSDSDRTVAGLRSLLSQHGWDDEKSKQVEYKEVFEGYASYVQQDRWKKIAEKSKFRYLFHSVKSEDSLVAILKTSLKSINERNFAGVANIGASYGSDVEKGASDGVPLRVVTDSGKNSGFHAGSVSGIAEILIHPDELDRMDLYMHPSDTYGACKEGSSEWQNRATVEKAIAKQQSSYNASAELYARKGVSREKFLRVTCSSENTRASIIKKAKAAGILEVNGVPIEDFIVAETGAGDAYDKYVKPFVEA